MNYEEKYKQALAWMSSLYYGLHGETKKEAERFFPELKESEDEMIRKVLINYFNKYKEQKECGINTFYGIPTDDILDWLEKQNKLKTELVDEDEIEEEIYWLAWVIGRLPDTEQANEAEAVLRELLGKLEKIKARRQL